MKDLSITDNFHWVGPVQHQELPKRSWECDIVAQYGRIAIILVITVLIAAMW